MGDPTWQAVDDYLGEAMRLDDEALGHAVRAAMRAGLPEIQVSATQGMLLHILARSVVSRRILEIGTLAGYSTIWLAKALPHGGQLVTMELDAKHADVARQNLDHAGLLEKVEIRIGDAIDLLPALAAERSGPFDLTFIDADKANTAEYFAWALQMSRPGSLIVVDNVVRAGALADRRAKDEAAAGMRRYVETAAGYAPRVTTTVIQTVGSKGHDGFGLSIVNSLR